MMQSLLLALYPFFQHQYQLSFLQVGLITLSYQFSASLLQPFIGRFTDKRPMPLSLPIAMCFTAFGLVILTFSSSYSGILLAALSIGVGSAIFHPESSRLARMASGGKHGLAQSIFQVGGTFGAAAGPLVAAWVVLAYGQISILALAVFTLLGIVILHPVSKWYARQLRSRAGKASLAVYDNGLNKRQRQITMVFLLILVFSKFVYLAGIHSYFTFYLMTSFDVSMQVAQYALFIFLLGVAIGTLIGGPLGDKIGRRRIIVFSILGSAPFALMLPYVGFMANIALIFMIGLVLSSAFPAMLVYGQEVLPGNTGAVSGLFFGLAFGIAGIGAAVIGVFADYYDIHLVYQVCAFLPLLGCVGFFLPELKKRQVLEEPLKV